MRTLTGIFAVQLLLLLLVLCALGSLNAATLPTGPSISSTSMRPSNNRRPPAMPARRAPKIIPVIARVKNRSFNVSCALAGEVCDEVGRQLGVPGSDLAAVVTEEEGYDKDDDDDRRVVLLPSDSIAEKGLRPGSVLRIMRRRRTAARTASTASQGNNSSASQEDFIRKSLQGLSKGFDPASLQSALSGLEEMLRQIPGGGMGGSSGGLGAMMDAFFNEDSLEAMRKQTIENIDLYEKLIPGMREHIASLASDPNQWKAAMAQARKQLEGMPPTSSSTTTSTRATTSNGSTSARPGHDISHKPETESKPMSKGSEKRKNVSLTRQTKRNKGN